ncbi:hypothetical protein DXG01_010366 [Tephrocybe rancida]|nr:hypothetical protein DXG01_010366 [Tephrocybe rancida]
MHPPESMNVGNKYLFHVPNTLVYFYIDADSPCQHMKQVHAVALKGYIVFDNKVQNNNLDNVLVPLGYPEFTHSINKDGSCPWGFAEVNISVPEWIVVKPSPTFGELGVRAPSGWGIRTAGRFVEKFEDRVNGRFSVDRVDTALHAVSLVDSLNVQLALANNQIQHLRTSRGCCSGASTPGHSVEGSPYVRSPLSSSPSRASEAHMAALGHPLTSAAGGSFIQHHSSSPAFTESDYGAPSAYGYESPAPYTAAHLSSLSIYGPPDPRPPNENPALNVRFLLVRTGMLHSKAEGLDPYIIHIPGKPTDT